MDKKIVLISGATRSGSTVMEMVLTDQLPSIGIGEVKCSWQRGFKRNELCSCGSPGKECSFWQPVLTELLQRTGKTVEEIEALRFSVERNRYFVMHRLLKIPSSRYAARRQEYAEILRTLYGLIWEQSGRNLIIDGSKDPAHVDLVTELFPDKTIVLHLIRDPRGFVFSYLTPKRRTEVTWKEEFMDKRGPFKSALLWMALNVFTESQRGRTDYRQIIYERDLVSVEQLKSTVDDLFAAAEDESEGLLHSISGNPVRIGRSKDLKLSIDERWRTGMKPGVRAMVTALCSPLMRRYGYKLS
ncbi:sulfotransferase [Novosphingobium decolorationis]|uniref:Sulfotransferase n=1 Tax=Novosphingobium decolorationis TaxID=2698673 RepID=A0ABX8E6N2_9SPHN|nr:sulfotransferase [Novosphingobium decolorationis]QVM83706.1 sulfotransferase [Novosphingobium decolorationis]